MIKPTIDYSWVPSQLTGFVSTMLGTLILVLVAGMVTAVLWMVASKLSGNFFIEQGRGGIAIICTLIAAALVASLPQAIMWGTTLDAAPNGIDVSAAPDSVYAYGAQYGANSKLAEKYGAATAANMGAAHAKDEAASRNMNAARTQAKSGDLIGAAGSVIRAGGDKVSSAWNTGKAAISAVAHVGFKKSMEMGWHAIGNKVGQFFSWITGR